MKVDSKHITPVIDTLKSLLDDISNGFSECEDREQCVDSFDYVHEQIRSVLNALKSDHLTPILKPSKSSNLPSFVIARDRMLDEERENGKNDMGTNRTDYEEKIHFMARMYFIIKRKLEKDGVSHLYTIELIQHHIYHYLLYNDNDINYYFNTKLGEHLHKVVETIVDEIIDARKKAPQLLLDLTVQPEQKSTKLIDLL